MSRPIYEPSLPRADAELGYGNRQLFRRPAPRGGDSTVYWAVCGDVQEFTAVPDNTWTQIELAGGDTNDVDEVYFDFTSVPFGLRLTGGYLYQVAMFVYWGGFYEGPTEIGWGIPPGAEYKSPRTPAAPPGTPVNRFTFGLSSVTSQDITLGAWQNSGSPAAEGHGAFSAYVVGPSSGTSVGFLLF